MPVAAPPTWTPSQITGIAFDYWAGANREHLTLDTSPRGDDIIVGMADQTSNSRDCSIWNSQDEPGTRQGVTLSQQEGGPWSTSLHTIGVHRHANGNQHYANAMIFSSPLSLTGAFSLFAGITLSRHGGRIDDLFGHDELHMIRVQQPETETSQDGAILLRIGSTDELVLTESVPAGAGLLEVHRAADGSFDCFWNGSRLAPANPVVNTTATLTLDGWGYKEVGTSQLDDNLLFLSGIDGTISADSLLKYRAYQEARWKMGIVT